MSQNVPQIGQNYILMTRIGQKKVIIGQKWSKTIKLDVPNMFELVQNWPKNGQEQDFNKVHLEK